MPIEKWTPIIGVIVSVMALIFQLTAFASNGWSITTRGDTTYRSGVWYATTCVENTGCETSSWYESYADYRDGYLYAVIVRKQAILTIGVALSIVCVILTVEALSRSMNDKRRRLVVILSSLLSCTFWFYVVGLGLKEYDIYRKKADDRSTLTVYFPWSLFSALIGAQFMLILCSIYLTIECRSENSNNHQTDRTQDGNQSYVIVTVPNVIYST